MLSLFRLFYGFINELTFYTQNELNIRTVSMKVIWIFLPLHVIIKITLTNNKVVLRGTIYGIM